MSPLTRTLFIGLPVALASLPGAAQATPPLQGAPYQSAFEGYQPFAADTAVQDWRRSNDTVREIGGWRAYARESSGAASPDDKASKQEQKSSVPASQPAPAHAGHHR